MWAFHYWNQVHEAILAMARHGLKSWKAAMVKAVETGHLKPIGCWIKGSSDLPILYSGSDFYTDPDLVGKKVRDAWAEVYCPSDFEVMSEEQVSRVASSMKTLPWTMPALTSEMLKRELARKGDSAAGPDNITLTMLKALPDRGLECLAQALILIEQDKIWPEELTTIAAVAIPRPDKKACVGPLKYRVISITSHVYRLWAGVKAHFLHQHWLPHVVPASRVRKGGRRQGGLRHKLS